MPLRYSTYRAHADLNQAFANMDLETTQRFPPLFDAIARHTPEGVAFKQTAEDLGFKAAVARRDGEMNQ